VIYDIFLTIRELIANIFINDIFLFSVDFMSRIMETSWNFKWYY